ncbi:transcription antitermination factor NusB [Actinobacillus minor]|uniref:transcription antitermination factor NusB n=1 Tax=Actinobacillus minor TaxID=51047 RepID=UPI0026ED3660|nr:transcription antitermination factor NusB [Actinobacillus minor]
MKLTPRRRARECAVQALYSWAISQNSVEEIELVFHTDTFAAEDPDTEGKIDKALFTRIFRGTVASIDEIDRSLQPFLDRNPENVDLIERSILRMAAFELHFEQDTPYKVIINEAIEVAKAFGSDDSHKYINGILDKLAPSLGRK